MSIGMSLIPATPSEEAERASLDSGGPLLRAVSSMLATVVAVLSVILVWRGDMPVASGVLLFVLALGLLLKVHFPPMSTGRRVASVLSLLATISAAVLIIAYLAGLGSQASPLPSPYTAASILLLSWATYALDSPVERTALIGSAAALSACILPALALLRQAPDVPAGAPRYASTLPISSAVLILLLAIAILAARPGRAPLRNLSSSGALPFAVLALVALITSWSLAWALDSSFGQSSEPRRLTTVIVLLQLVVLAAVMVGSLVIALGRIRERERESGIAGADRAFHALTDASHVGFALIDADGRIATVNPALCAFLGSPPEELLGRDWRSLNSSLSPAMAGQATSRLPFTGPGPQGIWGDVLVTPAGRGDALVLQVVDVTAAELAAARLEWAAHHDDLTGVLSRETVLRHLAAILSSDPRSGAALLLVDMDNFRFINDAIGTEAADEILRDIARLVQREVGDGGAVGRMYGDGFLVIGPAGSAHDRARLASRISTAIATEELSPERPIVTASVGTATTSGEDAEADPLDQVVAALTAAKSLGPGGIADYDEGMQSSAHDELEALKGLRALMAADDPNGELQFWFQPIVDLRSRHTVGYEELARWQHPTRGLLTGDAFIPAAERDLTIISWLARRGLDAAAAHARSCGPEVTVTVNLSGRQIASAVALADFVDHAVTLAAEPGVSLGVEITETVAARLTGEARQQFHRLADAGCALYLDDFGSGYSSIAHLRDLPISVVKLDRDYTQAAVGSAAARRLAAGMAALTASMSIASLAEGIEDEVTADALASAGWVRGQGWLFGRPAPSPTHLD